MLPVLIVAVLIVAVVVLGYITRDKDVPVKCCDPAPWPPSDIDARHAAGDARVASTPAPDSPLPRP